MIKNIIFDLGGVLVDWNPLYVYSKVFDTTEEANWFINNICTLAWNEEQDGGRTIAEAEKLLIAKHPEWEKEIKIYYNQWAEMLNGSIEGTVQILNQLRLQQNHRLLALTNWSAETFPEARRIFEFFGWFEGILVSGEENLKKPDPRIYQLILDRYQITAPQTLFIDDNLRNIKAAERLGIQCIHFVGVQDLKRRLQDKDII